jgi:hypothetical protein
LAWRILVAEDHLALLSRVAQKYVTVFMKWSTKMDAPVMLELHLAGAMIYAMEAEPERLRPLASASRLSSAA